MGLLLIWLSWMCAGTWLTDANYGHGIFVPFIAAYFFIRNLQELPPDPTGRKPWVVHGLNVVAFLFSLLILPVELVRLTALSWRVAFWFALAVMVGTFLILAVRAGGWKGLRWAAFPCLLLATAVPWPTFLEMSVVRSGAWIVATVVSETLFWIGIPSRQEGVLIALPVGVVGIAEACSGIRSLQSALMIALVLGEYFYFALRYRIFLVLVGIGLALLVNYGRALTLCLVADAQGMVAMESWHDPLGIIAFVVLAVLLGLVCVLLVRRADASRPPAVASLAECWSLVKRRWHLPYPVMVAGVVCFALAHLWYSPVFRGGWEADGEVVEYDQFRRDQFERVRIPAQVLQILGADRIVAFRVPTVSRTSSDVYYFRWDPRRENGQVLYHRPDVCMPGAGWEAVGFPDGISFQVSGVSGVFNSFLFERRNAQRQVLWAVWLDGRPFRFDGLKGRSLQVSLIPELLKHRKQYFAVEILAVYLPPGKLIASPMEAGEFIGQIYGGGQP